LNIMNLFSPKTEKRKISPFFLLKLCLGTLLIIWLFVWQGNGAKIVELFTRIKLEYLLPLFLLVFLLNLVSCLKWRLFIKEYGVTISIWRLLGLYCIGKFLDNFFPSTLGGDVARSYLLGKQIQSHGRSFASVALERLTGLVAMITLALVFGLLNQEMLKEPLFIISFTVIGSIGCALAILFIFPRLVEKIVAFLAIIPVFAKLLEKVRIVVKEMYFFRKKFALLAMSMCYSFLFHLMTITLVYLVCRTISFTPDFLDVALVTPVILLIATLPLTPSKLGVWEWAFGVFLVQAGGELAEGVAVSLLIRGLGLVVAGIGGILLLVEKGAREESVCDDNV